MRVGVDLLWVRLGKCGGTESYIRNLLEGFSKYDTENKYILFVSEDNGDSFTFLAEKSDMEMYKCPTRSASPFKRILWENLYLDRMAKKAGVDVMFIPVYSKPHTWGSKIPYVSVIHDLQALHYPQYFSSLRRYFFQASWRYACRTSCRVITDSNYCKQDLIEHYPYVKDRIQTIYVPIITEESNMDPGPVMEKYGIESEKYFYCVSSMLPHKNLDTILRMMAILKKQRKLQEIRLVISGVGGQEQEFRTVCRELDIEDCVIQTGFVSNEERDCLYENCRTFLFPSIFEGFGMPPIEAMRKGKNVVMAKCSCLLEVTDGKAIYVENPFDEEEWIAKIEQAEMQQPRVEPFEKYNLENVVRQYVEALRLE